MNSTVMIGYVLVSVFLNTPTISNYIVEPVSDTIYATYDDCQAVLHTMALAAPEADLQCAQVQRQPEN